MDQVIWYIDENERDLRTYSEALRKAILEVSPHSEIKVETILARQNLSEYTKLLTNPRTICIFVDQKMRGTGETDHNGIDVALFLRKFDNRIPICILTANSGDDETNAELDGNEWSIEYVFEKSAILPSKRPNKKNANKKRELVQRLLRRLIGYQEIVEKTEERFLVLLKKGLSDELSEDERKELELLETDRSKAIIYEDNQKIETIRNAIESLKSLDIKRQQIEERITKGVGHDNPSTTE